MRMILTLFLFLFSFFIVNGQDKAFVTTWDTRIAGFSCESCVQIPIFARGQGSFKVDWENDGVYDETGLTDFITHDYGTPGIYTIAISGDSLVLDFSWEFPDQDFGKLLFLDQWGDVVWSSLQSAFFRCENLVVRADDAPDLTLVKQLFRMFSRATKLTGDFGEWDVSGVTSFFGMFSHTDVFNSDLSSWDLSSAITLGSMFEDAKSFNGDLSNWNVSNVSFFSSMFEDASMFNTDISDWDVSGAVNMVAMFEGASSFNQDLSGWDVSEVASMSRMFEDAVSFESDLRDWQVSNVVNMKSMFENATSFNSDLKKWDVSAVVDMESMFETASAFNGDLFKWNLVRVEELNHMLDNCAMDPSTYQATLEGWASNPDLPDSLTLGSLNLKYCDTLARNKLLSKSWTIIGDAPADESDCTSKIDDDLSLRPVISPNPIIDDHLIIKNLDSEGEYSIVDIRNGKNMLSGIFIPKQAIDLTILPAGLYMLRVKDRDRSHLFKFTKTEL